MEYGYIDSHAHLMDDTLLVHLDDVIKRALDNNVVRIMLIALNDKEMQLAIKLKELYPMLDLACGFHPSDVNSLVEEDWKKLEIMVKTGHFSAIGEIGLDYYWVKDNKELQKEVFIRQLKLADKYNLPTLIHMRDATQDTYDILSVYSGKKKGVMHCYTQSVEMAKSFINQGFLISLAGPLTFSNAKENLKVAKEIPLDKLLIETDTPYLTPTPYRGKLNEPSYVKYVGEKLADLKGIDKEVVKRQLFENYHKLFK